MAEVKWIKISTNIFDDEAIKLIEQMPEGDAIIVIWFKLLAKAGKTNNGGLVYFKEDIPYTEEMLATVFNKPLVTVRLALKVFEQFGMIEITDASEILIRNWEKHQNITGLDQIREYNRIAKRKQRARQKELLLSGDVEGHTIPNIDVTTDKVRYGGNYYNVINRDNCKCVICGSAENLLVHHIDGYDVGKPENNSVNKMITLCTNCHGSVHAGENIEDIKQKIGYYVKDIQGNVKESQGIDIDKEEDIDIDKEEVNNITTYVNEFFNLYNSIAKRLPKAQKLSESRKAKIKARLKNADLKTWEEVFTKCEASDFCCGVNNQNWTANIDWLISNDNNYVKVLEGKYDNKLSLRNNSNNLSSLQSKGMDIL